MQFLQRLDRLIGTFIAGAQWLAMPLILLLFLQWPLRDIVRGYSREANDLGQIIFALFVAVSVTAATRAGTHLSSDALAHRYSARTRHRLRQFGAAFAVLPWAIFIILASKSFLLRFRPGAGTVSGHLQSRLLYHQGRNLDHGGADDRAGRARYFSSARR